MGLIFQEPMTRLDPLMRISEHFDEELKSARAGPEQDQSARPRALDSLRALGIPPTRYGTTRTSSPAACVNGS